MDRMQRNLLKMNENDRKRKNPLEGHYNKEGVYEPGEFEYLSSKMYYKFKDMGRNRRPIDWMAQVNKDLQNRHDIKMKQRALGLPEMQLQTPRI